MVTAEQQPRPPIQHAVLQARGAIAGSALSRTLKDLRILATLARNPMIDLHLLDALSRAFDEDKSDLASQEAQAC
jgi:hypothetical protein